MGRTQTFDTTAVVRAARDVFWEHGFDGASLAALEASTGLNRSSLYHAFGSKRGLFDAAVEDYLTVVIRPRLAPLVGPQTGTAALLGYFTSLHAAVAALPDDSPRRGCLLVNSTAGLAAQDAAARDVVDGYRAELTAALRTALGAGHPDLAAAALERTSRVLASLSIGAMVVARINQAEALALLSTATEVVDALPGRSGGEPGRTGPHEDLPGVSPAE